MRFKTTFSWGIFALLATSLSAGCGGDKDPTTKDDSPGRDRHVQRTKKDNAGARDQHANRDKHAVARRPADRDRAAKGFPDPEGGQGGIIRARNITQVKNELKQIGLAFMQYDLENNKGPANVQALTPYFERNARLTQLLASGKYVFHWNLAARQMEQGASNTILAYEKVPDRDGDRVVVMGDASIRVFGADDFQKRLKAQGK
jgi:hypothetical protein